MRARVVEVLVWWAVAYGIWLVSLAAVTFQELIAGMAVSLSCAFAAYGVRWAVGEAWTVRPGWMRPLLVLPLVLVLDTVQVLSAVATRSRGRFTTVPTGATGDDPDARSRRAMATIFLSVTPGSYVLDADPRTGDLLVHSLARRGPRMKDHL